jgi:hypothetical protein
LNHIHCHTKKSGYIRVIHSNQSLHKHSVN